MLNCLYDLRRLRGHEGEGDAVLQTKPLELIESSRKERKKEREGGVQTVTEIEINRLRAQTFKLCAKYNPHLIRSRAYRP